MPDDDTTPMPDGDPDGQQGEGGEQKPPKTYSKAEVDAMTAKAIAKVRREFGDVAELREKAARLDELEQQSKTEADRLREKHDKAVRERDAANTRATNTLVRASIMAEAGRQGAVDPEAVAALVNRADLTVEGDEVEGVEEAVKALLISKPYLLRQGSRRAGADQHGGAQDSPVITRTQLRRWMVGEDGGLTPERWALIQTAEKAGTIRDR